MPDKKKKASAVRDEQISKLLEQEVSMILESLNDSRLNSLEVIRVESRSSGNHFLIVFGPPKNGDKSFTGIENPENIMKQLERARGYIRSELTKALNLKRSPTISFLPDPMAWSRWS